MNSDPAHTPLPNRREILIGAIQSTVAVSLTFPALSPAVSAQATPSEPADFIIENDYPFFGYDPEAPHNTAVSPLGNATPAHFGSASGMEVDGRGGNQCRSTGGE
ncbi:MAG: hypothetical protein R3F31_12835 [Verrucomicrobiales bacterium]